MLNNNEAAVREKARTPHVSVLATLVYGTFCLRLIRASRSPCEDKGGNFRVRLSVRLAAAALMLTIFPPPAHACVEAWRYWPLAHDDSWHYSYSGTFGTGTIDFVVLSSQKYIDGIWAYIVRPYPDDPNVITGDEYFTNDEDGLRLHGGKAEGMEFTFDPPILLMPACPELPWSNSQNGRLKVRSYSFDYSSTASLEPGGRQTVPAGTFDNTVKVVLRTRIWGCVMGNCIDETETDTYWLAEDWGSVRGTLAASGFRIDTSLTDFVPGEYEDFESNGGYEAYLADAGNADLLGAGICDEQSAFRHWYEDGQYEWWRGFAAGSVLETPDYLIEGGFTFKYDDGYKEVILTANAPKPPLWDGPDNLLNRCDRFNLGPSYSATEYRDQNPDVADASHSDWFTDFFLSVTDHYVKYGFKEGRITNSNWTPGDRADFDSDCYLAENPDVATYFNGAASQGWSLFGKIGFSHYMNYGQFEGRPACWY